MGIKHSKVSTKADGVDTTVVRPTDWNDDHDIEGDIEFPGDVTAENFVTDGNVDGRDVSVDGAKLDGIEASADKTDATNVAAAGALMDSGTDNIDNTHINWGSGAGQVDADDVPESATRKWAGETGATTDQTGAEIKTLYEAEADTNAYTDTEKTKLAGIASGADVTGSNAPQAHKDSHDPNDGSDALDTAAASEIAGVQAAGTGTSHSLARADHVHAINHGIADNHIVTVDGASNAPVNTDYAKWTANGLEGMEKSQILSDLNVADGADVTGSNAPQAHASTHDAGGSDQVHSIADDDDDTKIQVEESADEDKIRMDVAGVEAFLLSAIGVQTLAKQSGCYAYRSSAQSIPSANWTSVELTDELYDVQNEFDSAANYRFTATEAGKYVVGGAGGVTGIAANKITAVRVYKNGATEVFYSNQGPGVACDPVCFYGGIVDLAASDYLDMDIYQSDAAAKNTLTQPSRCFFSCHKIA